MLSKYTSTICFFLAALVAIVLASGAARAEIFPSYLSNQTISVSPNTVGWCNVSLETNQMSESGCCEPGGTCIEKQCCSHIQTSSHALVETTQAIYSPPLEVALVPSLPFSYTSMDLYSFDRPPIT